MIQFGLLFWSLDDGAEMLRHARDVIDALPEDVNVMVVALNAPPAPFVPEEHQLKPGYAAIVVGTGDPATPRRGPGRAAERARRRCSRSSRRCRSSSCRRCSTRRTPGGRTPMTRAATSTRSPTTSSRPSPSTSPARSRRCRWCSSTGSTVRSRGSGGRDRLQRRPVAALRRLRHRGLPGARDVARRARVGAGPGRRAGAVRGGRRPLRQRGHRLRRSATGPRRRTARRSTPGSSRSSAPTTRTTSSTATPTSRPERPDPGLSGRPVETVAAGPPAVPSCTSGARGSAAWRPSRRSWRWTTIRSSPGR